MIVAYNMQVDEHEKYFNTIKQRVEDLRPILQKISRRETVVQERIELEHIQLNPERLTARGPNAREERLYSINPFSYDIFVILHVSQKTRRDYE